MYGECQVVTEYESDKVYYTGSYEQCKSWIELAGFDEFSIQSCTTGRLLTVVWGD